MSNGRVNHKDHLPQTLKSTVTESGLGFVPDTATGECKLPASGGESNVLGIWPGEEGASGDRIELVTEGVVLARVNGNSVNIAVGDYLKIVVTTGRFEKAATDKDAYFLQALEASTADGDLIACRITRGFLAV